MRSKPAVEASGLEKRYRLGEHRSLQQTVRYLTRRKTSDPPSLEALAGIDFSIFPGEAVGIVGQNGSGKSTLLQILSGITLPTGGRLVVRGDVIPLLAVGTGFHPELTGRENVMLFGATLRVPRRVMQGRVDDVAAFAELETHMETPTKRFSSGMLSRLSFAIAVLFPAQIYVFDEVLAVVDGEFRDRCLREIKKLSDSGRTVIFVSHDLSQVSALCNRTIWLEHGHIREFGPTDEVLDAYEQHAPAPAA
jgi:lipopolysaccharide transport system ATP-binding protein